MFTNDYIMRQIELLGKAAARVFKKETKKDDNIMEVRATGDADSLSQRLYDLVDEGQLCEAEDELFDYCKENPTSEVFAIAVEFYNMLGDMSDQELLLCNFPREEIAKGLSEIIRIINSYS